MYGREYDGKTYTLEASGGLTNSSLVMQDRETDSYWSLMKSEVVAGKLKGLKVNELPVGERMRWADWKKKHPDTLVFTVRGRQDDDNVYADYFSSRRGFRGQMASDHRLDTKDPIFAFRFGNKNYAIEQDEIEEGAVFQIADIYVFLYRNEDAEMFESTSAFTSREGFEQRNGVWYVKGSECRYDVRRRNFSDATCAKPLAGFDTFWYNWSLNNPDTQVLEN